MTPTNLPTPTKIAQAHSQQLTKLIQGAIQQSGPISFAEFMELALYAPGLGYYAAGAQKFGKAGDFVTAPEISPLFGRCLAAAFDKVLPSLVQPVILELGAGSGKCAADILSKLQTPIEAYYILEVSAELIDRQKTYLQSKCPEHFSKIHWLTELPKTPINGVIFGNEVIDALPVTCFEKRADKIIERKVALQDNQFVFEAHPADATLTKAVQALPIENTPYCSELHLQLQAWLSALNNSLAQGMLLFIDYGFSEHAYYHPDRHQGTLMCHYRHRAHGNPFLYPGLQDITAHVDFTALALSADALGLEVAGYSNQANFLIEQGIEQLANPIDIRTSQQCQTLLFPHEMGELFKVMVLSKNCPQATQLIHNDQQETL